jgi:hypothetical protein
MFFLPFRQASAEETVQANQVAANHPVWPAAGSVFIENGVMVVVLGKGG